MTDAEQDLIDECLAVDAEACAGDHEKDALCRWLNRIKAKVFDVRAERRKSAEREVVEAAERLADQWAHARKLYPETERLFRAVDRMRGDR